MKKLNLLLLLLLLAFTAFSQKKLEVGTLADTTYLHLKSKDNTDAIQWDNGKFRLRHHYDMLVSDRDFMRILIDADNNQDNAEFAIYKDTFQSGINLPVVRFNLNGFHSWINSGNFGIGDIAPTERLSINGAIKIGNSNFNTPGVIRYFNNDFQGYTNGSWQSLTQDADVDPTNEIQNLLLTGNSLKILGGNSVMLPTQQIHDADNDTYISAEFSADDDKITIGLAAQQRMNIANTTGSGRTYLTFPNNGNNILIGANAANIANTGVDNIYLGGLTAVGNQSGSNNVMIGRNIASLSDGQHENVYIGNQAAAASSGSGNIAIGYQAGNAASSISRTVIVGTAAGKFVMSSSESTLIGYKAGEVSTSHFSNTFIGAFSGQRNTTGSYNVGLGTLSGKDITTGSDNVAIGNWAGDGNETGSDNTYVGSYAGTNIQGVNNSMALGNNTTITASNQIRVGFSSVTSIGGYEPWTNISDGRFKTNVEEGIPGLTFINMLRPVTYNLKARALEDELRGSDTTSMSEYFENAMLAKEQRIYSGFIAQEVEAAAQSLGYNFSGVDEPKNEHDFYGLRYAMFTVPLVKAVQELAEQNDALQNEIAALKLENNELQAQLETTLNDFQSRLIQLEQQASGQ